MALAGSQSIPSTESTDLLKDAYQNQKPIVSDGETYDSLTDALNAVSDGGVITLPPGTYSGNFTLDTTNVTLKGESREGVILDGGTTGRALTVSASKCTVKNLSVQNTSGGQSNTTVLSIVAGGAGANIIDVTVVDSDVNGIDIVDDDVLIDSVDIITADDRGISVSGGATDNLIRSVYMYGDNPVGDDGMRLGAGDNEVVNCHIDGCGDEGYLIDGDRVSLIGCKVLNAGDRGIVVTGDECTIVGNTAVATNANLDTSSATNLTQAGNNT